MRFAPIRSACWIVPSGALTMKPTLTRVIRKRQSGSGSVTAGPLCFVDIKVFVVSGCCLYIDLTSVVETQLPLDCSQ